MSSSPRARLLLISLVAAATLLVSCRGAAASPPPPPVYDTDDHELRADTSYHVLPLIRRGGPYGARRGGLTLAPLHGGQRCPLFVAQDASWEHLGLPVRFAPHGKASASADPTTVVRVSTDVRVSFRAYTTCVQSTEWHVESGKNILGARRHVVTGPVVGGPSPISGRENAFRVERVERYGGVATDDEAREYKLMWCGDEAACQALGVFRDGEGGAWFLGAAAEQVHVVVFQKAPSV